MRVYNFRDIGGVKTIHQKTVRKGLIYRTANVTHFNEKEAHHFAEDHGIKLYIDFRGLKEVEKVGKPTALIGKSIEWLNLPIDADDPEFGKILKPKTDDWIKLYKRIFEKNLDVWTKFFQVVAEFENPLTYGCLFGKDRTGIATSLLLHTLEVPEENIIADYHHTTKEIKPVYEQFKHFWENFPITEDEIFDHFLHAPKSVIQEFLNYVQTHPEDTPAGMILKELSTKTKLKLKKRLLL